MTKLLLTAVLAACMGVSHAGPFKFKFNGSAGAHSSTQQVPLVEDQGGDIPLGGEQNTNGEVTIVASEVSDEQVISPKAVSGPAKTTSGHGTITTGKASNARAASATAISEPATLALLMLVAGVALRWRRAR